MPGGRPGSGANRNHQKAPHASVRGTPPQFRCKRSASEQRMRPTATSKDGETSASPRSPVGRRACAHLRSRSKACARGNVVTPCATVLSECDAPSSTYSAAAASSTSHFPHRRRSRANCCCRNTRRGWHTRARNPERHSSAGNVFCVRTNSTKFPRNRISSMRPFALRSSISKASAALPKWPRYHAGPTHTATPDAVRTSQFSTLRWFG